MTTRIRAATVGRLLNALLDHFNLDSDYRLSMRLGIVPSHLNKIRNGKASLNAAIVLAIYDEAGWSIEKIRKLAGIGPIKETWVLRTTRHAREVQLINDTASGD